jgi:hypothetical protein
MTKNKLTSGLYTSPPLQKYPDGMPLTLVTDDLKYLGLRVMEDNLCLEKEVIYN